MQVYRYLELEEKKKFQSKTTTKDKLKQIENTVDLPNEVMELQLCKLFNCLPSDLDKEDYRRLIKLYSVNSALENYESWQHNDKIPLHLKLSVEVLKLQKELE